MRADTARTATKTKQLMATNIFVMEATTFHHRK
jgi:hypothetical protein